jgi:molybdopterin synthase sulfur carrier subunit
MSITIKYFAGLRELLGRSQDELDLEGAELTVSQVWQRLHPGRSIPKSTLAAVNRQHVPLEHRVENGDEVAFFPPVTGG